MNGYRNSSYANSLAEYGTPKQLIRSGGWVLIRKIPDTPYCDAMGLYPLFCCTDWSKLPLDLDELASMGIISATLVADPFGTYDLTILDDYFDQVRPFKEHYVADLSQPIESIVSKNHRYQVRRALKDIDEVEICNSPIEYLDDWVNMYDTLAKRHNIVGIQAFSRSAFIQQLQTPGILMIRAAKDEQTLGINLAYIDGNIIYDHLFAMSDEGYEIGASYPIYMKTIEYAAEKYQWIGFGARAGISNDKPSGLDFFKSGWSNCTRTAYICGKVFDRSTYDMIAREKKVTGEEYFPLYRSGEFSSI